MAEVTTGLETGLQERTARAVPAEHTERAGGWWLRHAPGCSWWVASVLPHGDASPAELTERIEAAEAYCAARGVPTLVQMTPGAFPEPLDELLEARGYERQASVSLQTAPTADVLALAPRGGALQVRLEERLTREWFEVLHSVVGGDAEAQWKLLQRVEERAAYASVLLGDERVGVGRAVVETGWAGIFSMATLPAARGKGAAGTVIGALADWASANAAEQMYLQVEHQNEGAARIYERVGFRELRPFYFRVKA